MSESNWVKSGNQSSLAPVAIFAYRRPEHLAKVLASLRACPEFEKSPVFVFSDGPKSSEDREDVLAVRRLLRSQSTANMVVEEAESNRGLASSIIAGVTLLCERYGRVIVIEDDLIVHPSILKWFNAGLDKYCNKNEVLQITGYQFRAPEFSNRMEGVFLKFVSSWTWATWGRAWKLFDPAASGWGELQSNVALRRAFDENENFPLSDMLIAQMLGRIDSWAIRWRWAAFKSGGLTLFPPRSLVHNIGFDSTATHNSIGRLKWLFSGRKPYYWEYQDSPLLPENVVFNIDDQRVFQRALRRTRAKRNAKLKRVLARVGLKRFGR